MDEDLRIAVLYICTGKYGTFWDEFYASASRHLFPENQKHYFVFTDRKDIIVDDVTVIYKEPSGFPMDSLLRFEMFLLLEKNLEEFDYVFFFNSNMTFITDVGAELLPPKGTELVGVIHPGYFCRLPLFYPYERNRMSKAFIAVSKGEMSYYGGGLIGGSSKAFIQLSRTCASWIRSDLDIGIIARFHDESHLNKYFSDRKIHQLDPGYAFPEDWSIPFKTRILLLDKVKHGGEYFNKQPQKVLVLRLIDFIWRLFSGAIWSLGSHKKPTEDK